MRVNAVSPGATKTARFQATRVVDPEMMDPSKKSLVRYAEPAEIADAVAFLAGPRSRFIHGQVLRVDGGETLFPGESATGDRTISMTHGGRFEGMAAVVTGGASGIGLAVAGGLSRKAVASQCGTSIPRGSECRI